MFNPFAKKILFFCTLFSLGFMSACSSETGSGVNTEAGSEPITEIGTTKTISGTTQKGPFVAGSKVHLFELDENLHQTGVHHTSTIDNDLGNYTIKDVSLSSPYVWMQVEGYYKNEFTGETSSKMITLNSLVDLTHNTEVNINVLNHLAFYRIFNLVENGMPVDKAQKQAESEVIKTLGFDPEDTPFENLSIFDHGEGDAKLLAISIVMLLAESAYTFPHTYDDGGAIIERMAKIALDIETDGTWDDEEERANIERDVVLAESEGALDKIEQVLLGMGVTKVPNYKEQLKKFTPKDPLFGKCEEENIVRHSSTEDADYICREGSWKNYYGVRNDSIPFIDVPSLYGTFVDPRDNKTYHTIKLETASGDSVTWLADNLAYGKQDESLLYPNTEFIGNLYKSSDALNGGDSIWFDSTFWQQERIQGVCPDGWHLPSGSEWKETLAGSEMRAFLNREKLAYSLYLEDDKHYYIAYQEAEWIHLAEPYLMGETLSEYIAREESPKTITMLRLSYASDKYSYSKDAYGAHVRCIMDKEESN